MAAAGGVGAVAVLARSSAFASPQLRLLPTYVSPSSHGSLRRPSLMAAAAAEPSFASHRRRSTTPTPRVVLHIDLDCFFCQVHELHDASLRGRWR